MSNAMTTDEYNPRSNQNNNTQMTTLNIIPFRSLSNLSRRIETTTIYHNITKKQMVDKKINQLHIHKFIEHN